MHHRLTGPGGLDVEPASDLVAWTVELIGEARISGTDPFDHEEEPDT